MFQIMVNGSPRTLNVPKEMPLLWVLRDVIHLTGTKFGCGIAQCGACTVHLDGQPVRSCVLPVGAVGARPITTIEAIAGTPEGRKVQRAWLEVDVVQCGYCQSGQIMTATALLKANPNPSDADIDGAMSGTSAGAGPIRGFAPRSSRPPRARSKYARPSAHEPRELRREARRWR